MLQNLVILNENAHSYHKNEINVFVILLTSWNWIFELQRTITIVFFRNVIMLFFLLSAPNSAFPSRRWRGQALPPSNEKFVLSSSCKIWQGKVLQQFAPSTSITFTVSKSRYFQILTRHCRDFSKDSLRHSCDISKICRRDIWHFRLFDHDKYLPLT